MSRRKKGRPVHGWLILDKPLELTSTAAVGRVKRLFDAKKAGHAGTLDPLATGVLPLALGEATKTVSFAMDGEKAYRFTVRWGIETTTDDAEGEIVAQSDIRPTLDAIEAELPKFLGTIQQVPPRFSAIKVDGNRAYDLARDGEVVELAAREVVIEQLSLVESPDRDTTIFEAVCGKGTYVRAIARDLGRILGCHGHVIALRRTRVGPFDEQDAWTFDDLEALARQVEVERADDAPEVPAAPQDVQHSLDQALLAVHAALGDLPQLTLSQSDASRIARGQGVIMRGRDAPVVSGAAFAMCKGRLLALVEVERGEVRPTRVFNLGTAPG